MFLLIFILLCFYIFINSTKYYRNRRIKTFKTLTLVTLEKSSSESLQMDTSFGRLETCRSVSPFVEALFMPVMIKVTTQNRRFSHPRQELYSIH